MSVATPSSTHSLQSSTLPSDRSIKRKLEDALQTLDEAVAPSPSIADQTHPAKKARTTKNLYATLAKYGIRKDLKTSQTANELESLSKTAPHLAAILSRSATRTRQALPWKLGHPPRSITAPSSTAEYRPSSMQSFLSRLSTFKLSTYSNKPSSIDAVASAKCGWVNDGKDRLVCGICDVSWVIAGCEGMSRDAANALVEKQRVQLVDMHKDGCPWRTRQCDDSIYRIPLQAPIAMTREIKARATALETVMQEVEIKHPMTSTQVQSLLSTVTNVRLQTFAIPDSDSPTDSESSETREEPQPSETAIITALFGWSILPPAPPPERPRTQSLSRASSVAPATPVRTPLRAASVLSLREGTPIPGTPGRARVLGESVSRASTPVPTKPDATLLHCALCQRRVGLWAFLSPPQTNGAASTSDMPKQPQRRQLDVLREHRSYCPYVVRSTVVPSMPAPQRADSPRPSLAAQPTGQNTVEGWRAVLTVVGRHGMARKQRLAHARSVSGRSMNEAATQLAQESSLPQGEQEIDAVEAMVAGVKSRGGKDLLKYVKGLLG